MIPASILFAAIAFLASWRITVWYVERAERRRSESEREEHDLNQWLFAKQWRDLQRPKPHPILHVAFWLYMAVVWVRFALSFDAVPEAFPKQEVEQLMVASAVAAFLGTAYFWARRRQTAPKVAR